MRLFQRLLVLVYALSMGALGADAADHHGQHEKCAQCVVPGPDRRKDVQSTVKSVEDTDGTGDPPALTVDPLEREASSARNASTDSNDVPHVAAWPDVQAAYEGARLKAVDVPDPPGRDPTDPTVFTLGPPRAPPVS